MMFRSFEVQLEPLDAKKKPRELDRVLSAAAIEGA